MMYSAEHVAGLLSGLKSRVSDQDETITNSIKYND